MSWHEEFKNTLAADNDASNFDVAVLCFLWFTMGFLAENMTEFLIGLAILLWGPIVVTQWRIHWPTPRGEQTG